MASPKNGDGPANGGPSKRITPDSTERPGVYVQVAGSSRKKKSSSSYKALESGNHSVEETRPAHASNARRNPGPLGMAAAPEAQAEPVPRSQSEVREKEPSRVEPAVTQPRTRAPRIVEVNDSPYQPRAESVNTNYRADMVRASAAPASLPPSVSVPPERLSAPSVLDAKPRLRSEPPPPARTPWGMIALVSVMSAIIAAAGVVAFQEWMHSQQPAVQVAAPAQGSAPAAPAAVAPNAAPSVVAPASAPAERAAPAAVAAPAPVAAAPAEAAPVAPVPAAPTSAPVAAAVAAPDAVSAAEAVAQPPAPAPVGRQRSNASHASHARETAVAPVPAAPEPAPAPAETAPIPDNPYAADPPVAP